MPVIYHENGETVYEHAGAVLATYEQNLAHDSYFYAIVWDPIKGAPRHVQYAATAYYSSGRAEVDATPDVIAQARRWAYGAWLERLTAEMRTTITPGANVRSLTTRGKARDLVGMVVHVMASKHGPGEVALVESGDGRRAWVPTHRLERLEITATDRMEIRWNAVRRAKGSLYNALRMD